MSLTQAVKFRLGNYPMSHRLEGTQAKAMPGGLWGPVPNDGR
jgi:hypothetical protein